MVKIKLKEWADKHNLSYLTANRHFHAGMIEGAEQLASGTILVEDDSREQYMAVNSSNDAMSLFLKKTVEFSKNNSSVEDFAAYVISNFTIKINGASEAAPRYSKNRPKPEEVQKHFQQFLPDKEKQEHLKAIKELIEKKGAPEALPDNLFAVIKSEMPDSDTFGQETDLGTLMANVPQILDHMYGPDTTTEGLVNRSVDFDTTPQQINYTGSNNQTFSIGANSLSAGNVVTNSASCFVPTSSLEVTGTATSGQFSSGQFSSMNTPFGGAGLYYTAPVGSTFQPTQKELLSSIKVIEASESDDAPRGKRGRKPSKKR